MAKIDLYTKQKGFCPRCKMTKRWLTQRGAKFSEHDVEQPKAKKMALSHGMMSAPVTVLNNDWKHAVSGFDPMKLANIVSKAKKPSPIGSFNQAKIESAKGVSAEPISKKHISAKRNISANHIIANRGISR